MAKGLIKTPRKAPLKEHPEPSPLELVLKLVPNGLGFPKGASNIVKVLQANQEMLRSVVADLQQDLHQMSRTLQDRGSSELWLLADKLNVLQSIMGQPPTDLLAPTLWQSVGDLMHPQY